MFKKRRQRAKKYTLVSFGSVDEDRSYEEEDGVFPTSESEFDEEGFSDARSLTNHSDWDNTYLDIEKCKSDSEQKEEKQKGLSEASGKGARLFEQQRERAGKYTVEKVPAQKSPQLASAAQPQQGTVNGDMPVPQKAESVPLSIHLEGVQVPSKQPATLPAQLLAPPSPTFFLPPPSTPDPFSASTTSMFNRSARPFTPGFSSQRAATSSVIFRPSAPKKPSESLGGQSTVVPPFSPLAPGAPANAALPTHRGPVSSSTSLYIPAPGRPTPPLESQPREGGSTPETKPSANTARTSTTSIFLSTPSKPGGEVASAASQPRVPGTASSSLYISPAPSQHVISSSPVPKQPSPAVSPAMPRPPSEPLTSREQRIAVPAPRTGILQEARRRGNKKPMFSKIEEKKKNSPNPELLSLVQNLDEKPKGDHPGTGFESGPEEDFLSLGAEACNFMQSSGRKFKTPPPVAPKPQQQDAGLVNGAQDMPQLKGKGAELFAKRQSRMDKFVVETTPKPESKPRTPSPSPSLPSSWKYSPNIRAPPPIAYNPMHSPFYPLAASKSQASKAESKVKKAPGQKSGIKVIDLMRHQPYQLKSAMFCFGDPPSPSTQESPGQPAPQASSSFTVAKQVPVKTAKTQEIRRFSTPAPMPASSSLAPTVLVPRSATTLDEPVWRTEMASSAPTTPAPFQVELSQSPKPYQSSPEPGQAGQGPSPNPASASRFQVARPKFSAARTGMQANVWRPSFGHHWGRHPSHPVCGPAEIVLVLSFMSARYLGMNDTNEEKRKKKKEITPLLHHPLPQPPLGLRWAATWQGLLAVATAGGRRWREGTYGTWRPGTCIQQQNPPVEGVNVKGCLTWGHVGGIGFPFPRALELPLNGGRLGGKSFPGRTGQRWDYSSEALASPLDCFSLSLSTCTHAPLCVHTHMHTAALNREWKWKWGFALDTSPSLPSGGAWERRWESRVSRGVCTCTCRQCALHRRVAMCAHPSSHQGWD